jgi:hypothetical protein
VLLRELARRAKGGIKPRRSLPVHGVRPELVAWIHWFLAQVGWKCLPMEFNSTTIRVVGYVNPNALLDRRVSGELGQL